MKKGKTSYGSSPIGRCHDKRFLKAVGLIGLFSLAPVWATQAADAPAAAAATMAQQQANTVSGTVVDSQGVPVIGAAVQVLGTDQGVITDIDGKFTVSVPSGGRLQVSYVGYKTQEIVPGNRGVVTVWWKTTSFWTKSWWWVMVP